MKLQLSIGLTSNPRTWPILDGRVKPDGIDLVVSVVQPSELFWRQLKFGDFDISEMSVSSLTMTKAAADQNWVGLPIFTTRHFFQNWILVRRDKVKSPADLKGKRVGVPEYQQTAALWSRGILQDEFGVQPKDMEFWMERVPTHSHRGAIGFTPPPGVVINQIPPEKNIGSMLESGELDATLLYLPKNNLVDRSQIDFTGHPIVGPLFEPVAEGTRYFRKTGMFPMNHGVVVKRSVVDQHPWVVLNLFKAFERAHEIANQERSEQALYHIESGAVAPETKAALAKSVMRHGIKANRPVLEKLVQYSHQQGLTPRLVKLEEIFAPSVMEQ
jgi:4,5-dihydroxyphthalate decarboxylase